MVANALLGSSCCLQACWWVLCTANKLVEICLAICPAVGRTIWFYGLLSVKFAHIVQVVAFLGQVWVLLLTPCRPGVMAPCPLVTSSRPAFTLASVLQRVLLGGPAQVLVRGRRGRWVVQPLAAPNGPGGVVWRGGGGGGRGLRRTGLKVALPRHDGVPLRALAAAAWASRRWQWGQGLVLDFGGRCSMGRLLPGGQGTVAGAGGRGVNRHVGEE